ncbi:MAG: glycosyltransferase, partial [Anaerolineales bacterium]|nr:glycosyltransferase [Anaerolineales bacterium]
MFVLALLVSAVLVTLAGIAILNAITFPRLRPGPAADPPARLSVLIPARDEAAVIGTTVRALLDQTGVDFEVLILDDDSTDGTTAAALAAAAGDARVRVLAGRPLPAGWLGKNWACHQLAQAAATDRLLFTDADVCWRPAALAAAAAEFERTRADLLTIWPTQITATWGERLVVPLVALAVQAYLPVLATHHLPGPAFAAAVGQGLLFRRSAYEALGGHAAVRGHVVEDVALARRCKAAGQRLRAAAGAGLVVCRMYRSWREVRAGFAKNILAGHGGQPALLLASTLFHWLIFIFPWVWLAAAVLQGAGPSVLLPLSLGLLGVGVRALSAAVTGQRVGD